MNLIELNRSLVQLRLSGIRCSDGNPPPTSAVGKDGAHRPDLHAGL